MIILLLLSFYYYYHFIIKALYALCKKIDYAYEIQK